MTGVQTETGVLAGDERMLIDGELQFTSGGATFDVIHPASEQVAGQATDGTVEDMARAVRAARRAFDETDWSRDLEFRYHGPGSAAGVRRDRLVARSGVPLSLPDPAARRVGTQQGASRPGHRGRLPAARSRAPLRR